MQVFNFGTIVADLAADSAANQAAAANLKFTNPVKVPCTVKFSVTPAGKGAIVEGFPISVSPLQLIIPPLESSFVQLRFQPKQIAAFTGQLKAVVDNGQGNASTYQFTCDVKVRHGFYAYQYESC